MASLPLPTFLLEHQTSSWPTLHDILAVTAAPALVYLYMKKKQNKKGYKVSMYIEKPIQFPLAPMGALAPGSAHARPSAQAHIDTNGNFSTPWREN